MITRISAQNIFFYLRKIDNRNKWKSNYVIITRVKLSIESDVLVIRSSEKSNTILRRELLIQCAILVFNSHV